MSTKKQSDRQTKNKLLVYMDEMTMYKIKFEHLKGPNSPEVEGALDDITSAFDNILHHIQDILADDQPEKVGMMAMVAHVRSKNKTAAEMSTTDVISKLEGVSTLEDALGRFENVKRFTSSLLKK